MEREREIAEGLELTWLVEQKRLSRCESLKGPGTCGGGGRGVGGERNVHEKIQVQKEEKKRGIRC